MPSLLLSLQASPENNNLKQEGEIKSFDLILENVSAEDQEYLFVQDNAPYGAWFILSTVDGRLIEPTVVQGQRRLNGSPNDHLVTLSPGQKTILQQVKQISKQNELNIVAGIQHFNNLSKGTYILNCQWSNRLVGGDEKISTEPFEIEVS